MSRFNLQSSQLEALPRLFNRSSENEIDDKNVRPIQTISRNSIMRESVPNALDWTASKKLKFNPEYSMNTNHELDRKLSVLREAISQSEKECAQLKLQLKEALKNDKKLTVSHAASLEVERLRFLLDESNALLKEKDLQLSQLKDSSVYFFEDVKQRITEDVNAELRMKLKRVNELEQKIVVLESIEKDKTVSKLIDYYEFVKQELSECKKSLSLKDIEVKQLSQDIVLFAQVSNELTEMLLLEQSKSVIVSESMMQVSEMQFGELIRSVRHDLREILNRFGITPK